MCSAQNAALGAERPERIFLYAQTRSASWLNDRLSDLRQGFVGCFLFVQRSSWSNVAASSRPSSSAHVRSVP